MLDRITEKESITGAATLHFSDFIAYQIATIYPRMITAAVLSVIINGFIWITSQSDAYLSYIEGNPISGLKAFLDYNWIYLLILFAAYMLMIFVILWISFIRMGKPLKHLTYEANAKNMTTRDAANREVVVPWALVKSVRSNKQILLMKLWTRKWRYAPWRAFAPEDREALLNFAREGTKAGQKGDPDGSRLPSTQAR